MFVAHSDVDPIFPIEGVRRQFDALPSPKYLLVLHRAAHAAVGENSPTPADEAYHVATTVFWDRCFGEQVDAEFPEGIGIAGVTTLRRRLVSSIGVFAAGRVGTKHSDDTKHSDGDGAMARLVGSGHLGR